MFLQYGALGLLTMVLMGFGFGAYLFLQYLRELIGVVRSMGEALSSVGAKVDQLDESIERHDSEERQRHADTRALVMRRSSPYPTSPTQ